MVKKCSSRDRSPPGPMDNNEPEAFTPSTSSNKEEKKEEDEGVFIGVNIDSTEFKYVVLDAKWKGNRELLVKESEAKTEKIPIVERADGTEERKLAEIVLETIKNHLLYYFTGRQIRKMIIGYYGSENNCKSLESEFRVVAKEHNIREPTLIECRQISKVYYDLVFNYKLSPRERLEQFTNDDDSSDFNSVLINGVIFWGATLSSIHGKQLLTSPDAPEHMQVNGNTAGVESSAYAIARNVIKEAKDFHRYWSTGNKMNELIKQHFELTNPMEVFELLNLENRDKLSSFVHELVPLTGQVSENDPLDQILRKHYKKARILIMNDHSCCSIAENLRPQKENPRLKMAFVIIGGLRKEEQFEYFKFHEHKLRVKMRTSIDWFHVDDILEKPVMAAALLASFMVLEQPLVPVDHKKFVNFTWRTSNHHVSPGVIKFQTPQS